MKIKSNKSGLTLIELIAVLVIIGVIAGIGFLTIGSTIFDSRVKSYEETISSLNQATEFYAVSENIHSDDIFEGLDSNSARLTELFSNGYISLLPQPVTPYSYVWNIENQTWILEKEDTSSSVEDNIQYDFDSSRLVEVVEKGGQITSGSFSDTGTSIDSSYGLLFIGNPNETYTVEVSASLAEGTSGGYGVFFETKLNNNSKDSGYIVQFDRGYSNGEIIIRARTNGSEGSPLFRYSIEFDNSGNGDFTTSGGSKNSSNSWWVETHNIKLIVELNDNPELNKKLSVYIDDIFLFEFAFESDILSGEENLNKTGLRVWTKPTTFYSIEVSE